MTNRLANATSPYLLQHMDNPVDWWEWGEDAFVEARRRGVPVLLSVGYAACHWCHVMAHESFEDQVTAAEMNRQFVNVKVDREERPDVDAIYMEAVQAMTGQGGWPMTVFIDHQGRPFFAGTYFPDAPRHGMPAFRQVIEAVSSAWRDHPDQVDDQAGRLVEAISGTIPVVGVSSPELAPDAYAKITALFDPTHGGFGGAPKFPQQPVLEFLLRVRDQPWATGADAMLARTLEAMGRGGIHDHLGGGFARYSVDRHWLVPHFEKMLYDNAQLARVYLWAGIELGRPDFIAIAKSTLGYLAKDLARPDGGFFSSEDADSEGVEGKFYVWSVEEIHEVLGDRAGPVIEHYGATKEGNFEGANILTIVGRPPGDLEASREKLLERREGRVRPGLDDKVVASWNGMAIRAFAEAGAALSDPALIEVARRAASFVIENLMAGDRLMRSWREGRVSVPAFAEDHAAMAVGLYALFAATAEEQWYQAADRLVGALGRFARPEGGFFTTSDDGETLMKRPFDVTDNPHPSGNALAAEALLMSSLYSGESQRRSDADSALAAAGLLMESHPSMVAHHLSVLDSSRRTKELAIVGSDWQRLASVYYSRFRPQIALAASAVGTGAVPLLEGRTAENGARAFVCRGFVCDLPTSDPGALAALLD
ncbi:MAG: thioredoxin domain-containing protein [Acidimicrobiia bacterium]